MVDTDIDLTDFEIQSRYLIHFQTNDTKNGVNSYNLIYGLNSMILLVQEWLCY